MYNIIYADPSWTKREIAQSNDRSDDRVLHILHKHLKTVIWRSIAMLHSLPKQQKLN